MRAVFLLNDLQIGYDHIDLLRKRLAGLGIRACRSVSNLGKPFDGAMTIINFCGGRAASLLAGISMQHAGVCWTGCRNIHHLG